MLIMSCLNNVILQFINECEEEGYIIDNQPTGEVYQKYAEFCIAANLRAVSRIEFSRQLTKEYGLEIRFTKVNKKTARVFMKIGG